MEIDIITLLSFAVVIILATIWITLVVSDKNNEDITEFFKDKKTIAINNTSKESQFINGMEIKYGEVAYVGLRVVKQKTKKKPIKPEKEINVNDFDVNETNKKQTKLEL